MRLQAEVEGWRAGLWQRALESQAMGEAAAAGELQRCFSQERMRHFQFVPGVPVSS